MFSSKRQKKKYVGGSPVPLLRSEDVVVSQCRVYVKKGGLYLHGPVDCMHLGAHVSPSPSPSHRLLAPFFLFYKVNRENVERMLKDTTPQAVQALLFRAWQRLDKKKKMVCTLPCFQGGWWFPVCPSFLVVGGIGSLSFLE